MKEFKDSITMSIVEFRKYSEAVKRVRELHVKQIIDHPKHNEFTQNDEDSCEAVECIGCMRSLPHSDKCIDSQFCGCYITDTPCTCETPIPGCTGWYHEECTICTDYDNKQDSYNLNYGDVYLRWPCPTIKALDGE